jgi:hypothetical protein
MRVEGLGELREIMKKLGSLEPVKVGLKTGAAHLKGQVAKEPRVSRRPQAQYWTDKQRRGFFAKLRSGEIEVPYYRGINRKSERLRQSWTVQSRRGGLMWIIGNDASYGPLVKDPNRQVAYHKKTGWKNTDQDVEENKAKINNIVKQVVDRALEGR